MAFAWSKSGCRNDINAIVFVSLRDKLAKYDLWSLRSILKAKSIYQRLTCRELGLKAVDMLLSCLETLKISQVSVNLYSRGVDREYSEIVHWAL
ncbi:hypothetical protein HI914_05027 [Erysiphe necator]|nr:hypothetical protein HI914_05027 [Erysiphe necator]